MQKVQELDPKLLETKGWTPVQLNVYSDGEITEWLQDAAGGRYAESYFQATWYFENEQDALLFKLKFGSYKGAKGSLFGIDWDVNSMYPGTITVMKARGGPKTQIEFDNEYSQHFMCDYEGIILKDQDAVYDRSWKATKVRSSGDGQS